jgi:hypothetical protein
MARTRWPPGPVNPGLLPGQADQTGSAGGCHKTWARPTDRYQDSPSGVSRFGGQAGTQASDATPHQDKPEEAGPEALPTSSLPTLGACSGDGLVPPCAADSPVMGATGCLCGASRMRRAYQALDLLPRADPERELHAPGPHGERRNSPPAAADSREHPLARDRGSRSFPGRLRFGQGNGAALAGRGWWP